jgi:tetratricopeptide (TPR) repeat protein
MWKEAARDFEVLFQGEPPGDIWHWYQRAHLLLQAGDSNSYRELCRNMRTKFGGSKNVNEIAILAHTWALAPQAGWDQLAVVELAQRRLNVTRDTGHYSWSFYVLGLAYYQTGRYADAVDLLQKRVKEDPQFEHNALNYLVLSLCLARLDREVEARRWLEKARVVMKDRDSKRWIGRKRYAPPDIELYDWWQTKTLEREADSLLRGRHKEIGPPAPDKSY